MKKLLSIVLALTLVFALAACTEDKTALDADGFGAKMMAEGFEIIDVTDQFEDGAVEMVLIAYNDDFQIEFYILEDSARASEVFEGNKYDFEEISGSGSSEISKSINNYDYYSKTTSDGFYALSRVDATFIYIEEDASEKDDIVEILKLLGY